MPALRVEVRNENDGRRKRIEVIENEFCFCRRVQDQVGSDKVRLRFGETEKGLEADRIRSR